MTVVKVRTPYARPEIPLAQVRRLEMREDHETVAVEMLNCDKVTGTVDFGHLKLDTSYGALLCGVQDIKWLENAPLAPRPAVRLATMHVSGEKQKRKVGASKSGKSVERAKAEYLEAERLENKGFCST